MKRGLVILALGAVGGCLAFCCSYFMGTAVPRGLMQSTQPELAWLKHEFKLTESEFRRITEFHVAYLPHCKERCRRIEELNQRLSKVLASASGVTPEIDSLLSERAHMRSACQSEMLKHFFEVSRSMPPEQGKRYLAWVREHSSMRDELMIHGTGNETTRKLTAHHHP